MAAASEPLGVSARVTAAGAQRERGEPAGPCAAVRSAAQAPGGHAPRSEGDQGEEEEAGEEEEDGAPEELPATVTSTVGGSGPAQASDGAAAAAAEAAKAARAAERQRLREERARGRAKAARARALHAKVSAALRPSLLGSLLNGPAVRETTVVLQCLRRIVEADFFKAPRDAST